MAMEVGPKLAVPSRRGDHRAEVSTRAAAVVAAPVERARAPGQGDPRAHLDRVAFDEDVRIKCAEVAPGHGGARNAPRYGAQRVARLDDVSPARAERWARGPNRGGRRRTGSGLNRRGRSIRGREPQRAQEPEATPRVVLGPGPARGHGKGPARERGTGQVPSQAYRGKFPISHKISLHIRQTSQLRSGFAQCFPIERMFNDFAQASVALFPPQFALC